MRYKELLLVFQSDLLVIVAGYIYIIVNIFISNWLYLHNFKDIYSHPKYLSVIMGY